jgi:predicted ArsR family transcriptional regulator
MNSVPLQIKLHPLCNIKIAAEILSVLESNPAVCVSEAAKIVGCSEITARKHLLRIVKAGLAIEKRFGKARVFMIKKKEGEGVLL